MGFLFELLYLLSVDYVHRKFGLTQWTDSNAKKHFVSSQLDVLLNCYIYLIYKAILLPRQYNTLKI